MQKRIPVTVRRRVLASLLALAILIPAIPLYSVPAGAITIRAGTESDPHLIHSAAGLQRMVNGNGNHHYILTQDITVTSAIAPNSTDRVRGRLNGAGRTINLHIANANAYVGLFGVAGDLQVKNLILTGSVFSGLATSGNTGALIASVAANAPLVTITDVISYASVRGGNNTGGLVGYATNTAISNCEVWGDVSGHENVGGIAGRTSSGISRCTVGGNVTATGNNAGGIVGLSSSASIIRECEMLGNVTGHGLRTGGIVGSQTGSAVRDCRVTGNVTGHSTANTSYVGGIVGSNIDSSSRIVERCYVSGYVSANRGVGGIVGRNGVTRNNFFLGPYVEKRTSNGNPPGRVNFILISGSLSGNRASDRTTIWDRWNIITPLNNSTGRDGLTVADASLRGSRTQYAAAGWDFDAVWEEVQGDYPRLRNAGAGIVRSVALSGNRFIYATEEIQLSANVLPSHALDKSVIWTSSNDSVATVDANGLVTGVSPGWAEIRATSVSSPGVYARVNVSVLDIFLDYEVITLKKNSEFELTVINLPSSVLPGEINWDITESDPDGVVSLDGSGVSITVTGENVGVAEITVSLDYNGYSYEKTCVVYVVEIELSQSTMYLKPDEFFTLQAEWGLPDAPMDSIEFVLSETSSNGIVSIGDTTVENGTATATITGLSAGTVTVELWGRLYLGEGGLPVKLGECTVFVVELELSITILPTPAPPWAGNLSITGTVQTSLSTSYRWYLSSVLVPALSGNTQQFGLHEGQSVYVIVDIDTPNPDNSTGIIVGARIQFTTLGGSIVSLLTDAEIEAIIA